MAGNEEEGRICEAAPKKSKEDPAAQEQSNIIVLAQCRYAHHAAAEPTGYRTPNPLFNRRLLAGLADQLTD